jgi:hypothetical protein
MYVCCRKTQVNPLTPTAIVLQKLANAFPRYYQFSVYGVEEDRGRKGRMEISPESPRPGEAPPPLPDYTGKLKVCKPDMIFDANENIDERCVSTLGAIMVSSLSRTQDLIYVAITAGHIIPDYQATMYVQNRLDNAFIPLKVAGGRTVGQ